MGKRKRSDDKVTKATVTKGKRKTSVCKVAKGEFVREKEIDHLSNLPDDICATILSLLPMGDAVRCGALSSKWIHGWKSIANINLTYMSMFGVYPCDTCSGQEDDFFSLIMDLLDWSPRTQNRATMFIRAVDVRTQNRATMFIRAVDVLLRNHVGIGVKKFAIEYDLCEHHASHLDKWLHFAVASGTEELRLKLGEMDIYDFDDPYEFPFKLFSGGKASSLKHLYLSACLLEPPHGFDGFTLLKVLHLQDVVIQENELQYLLSKCCALEWLGIEDCELLINLNIFCPSPHLKYVEVMMCEQLVKITISTPSLMTFEYVGPRAKLIINNAAQLVRASVQFTEESNCIDYILSGLSSDLPRLKLLFLCFDRSVKVTRPCSNYFTNLKKLVISVSIRWEINLLWLLNLLNAAPLLEIFFLCLPRFTSQDDVEVEVAEKSFERTNCPHFYLKEVKIHGFVGYASQMELAVGILKIAAVLELMTISPRVRFYTGNHRWTFRDYTKEQMRGCLNAYNLLLAKAISKARLVICE